MTVFSWRSWGGPEPPKQNRNPKAQRCLLVMHQSIPAAPSPPFPPPRATAGHLPTLSVAGVGHLQILCCLGPFPSFRHTRGFLSEYNYTEDWLICQGQQTSKRVVKACSWFYACISSLLIKPELHTAKSWAINMNQRFLVIESNFCWYYLKNTLSY